MKVLVTGGAGFIGSHIVRELVNQGYDVIVIDNLFTGKKEYIADVIDKIRFIQGDIRDFELLKTEFKDVDFVSHQAALRSVPASVKDPIPYNDVNVNGHFNVLEAARVNDVKKVVFASSSSAYGNSTQLPLKENQLPDPISPYAITKVLGEHYCKMFHELYGLQTVSLRYFNVFGPMQDPNSQYAAVIAIFIKKILNNQQPVIFGNGLQSRDFTFVRNNVDANILAFNAKSIGGRTINIANSEAISVNQLLEKINFLLNKDVKPLYHDPRPGDVMHTLADNTLAKELLNYKSEYSFDQGLKETIDFFKNSS